MAVAEHLDVDQAPEPALHYCGAIGEPLIRVPAAVLTPAAALEFAKSLFALAATACDHARSDAVGRG